jgi:hypothetical protein
MVEENRDMTGCLILAGMMLSIFLGIPMFYLMVSRLHKYVKDFKQKKLSNYDL